MHTSKDSACSFDGHVVPSVLEALNQKLPHDSQYHLLRSFIEKFYNFSYSTDMELGSEFLLLIAQDLYKFIDKRKPGSCMVRVFSTSRPNFPDESLTIIETANDNLPFIVDSIIIAIKKHNFPIYHYTNSVLNIKRGEDGIESVDMLPARCSGEDESCESVAYFVVGNADQESQEMLRMEVEKALHYVTHCVKDWHPMLDRMGELLYDFDQDEGKRETCNFLKWLRSGNFVFLGYEEYTRCPSSPVWKKLDLWRQIVAQWLIEVCKCFRGTLRTSRGAACRAYARNPVIKLHHT